MTGVILPSRDLTPDELRGFRMACACFETIGRQLAAQPVTLAGPQREAVAARLYHAGQTMVGYARAFDRTLGQGRAPGP